MQNCRGLCMARGKHEGRRCFVGQGGGPQEVEEEKKGKRDGIKLKPLIYSSSAHGPGSTCTRGLYPSGQLPPSPRWHHLAACVQSTNGVAVLLAWGFLTRCSCSTNLLVIFILFHLAELTHVFCKMQNRSILYFLIHGEESRKEKQKQEKLRA